MNANFRAGAPLSTHSRPAALTAPHAQRGGLAVPLRALLITPVGGSFLVLDAAPERNQQLPERSPRLPERLPAGAVLSPGSQPAAAPVVLAAGADPAAAVLAQVAVVPRRRVGLWLGLALLLAGATAGGWWWNTTTRRAAPALALAPVELRELRTTVTATGSLEAVTAIEVGAEVTGRVREIAVEENQQVRAGQVLAVIDADELAASVAQAMAQVASAAASVALSAANVTEARFNLERVEALAQAGVSSQQELQAARANLERSRAALSGAHAEAALARGGLAAARSKLGKSTIVSPIDGIVLARFVEPGQTVTAGFQTPVLFRVAQDLTKLRLRVELDEADVAQVHPDQGAFFEVAAFPGRQFPSRVVRVSHESRLAGNVVAFGVTLDVDNAAALLRPGMTCTATIITAERAGALAVPTAALRPLSAPQLAASAAAGSAEPSHELWLLREGAVVPVPVLAGIADDQHTEIVAGALGPGEQLVLESAP